MWVADMLKIALFLIVLLLAACSDTTVGDDVDSRDGMGIVATAEELPPCTAQNDGEPFFVKSEGIIRVCSDEKWYAIKDEESGENGGNDVTRDSTGTENGCRVLRKTIDSLWVSCGAYTFAVPASSANNGGSVVLDSEKVATSLEGVSGYSQKGPFINGSKVTVIELESGRTLNQTGNTFESKIQSDDGQFKLNARMMVSQYVELHAEGYYRNEITGENSEAPLTLYAITDVSKRDGGIVNINLLTHLEYHRVVYLVTKKKMKVFAAKDSAEKEIFNLLNINSRGFFSSEDLNIAGSSEGDAALLAFSVMFQGNHSVSQLTELLTSVSTDMEEDGTWDNTKVRDSIADWAENADATGKLDTIRANVESWGLSAMVPNFEKYIRSFWTQEYGLPTCDYAHRNKVLAAGAKRLAGSKERYICVDSAKVGYMWRRATDLEKDTDGWDPGTDAQIKIGDVTGTKKYVYDGHQERWREMTDLEEYYGVCTETVEADSAASVKPNKLDKIEDEYYPYVVCKNRQWSGCTAYYADTRKYGTDALDGTVRRGDYTTNVYVFEQNLGFWRIGWETEGLLNKGCTNPNVGEVIHYVTDNSDEYYSCRRDSAFVDYGWYSGYQFYKPGNGDYVDNEDEHWVETEQRWKLDDHDVGANTYPDLCEKEGDMVPGKVQPSSKFVCDDGFWRRATGIEELFDQACTRSLLGVILEDAIVCDTSGWRNASVYDMPKGYYFDDIEYGTMQDERDGTVYKTKSIGGGIVWMAENLNYGDTIAHPYLKGNTKCYADNPANCEKGGRLYTWTAAMDVDAKWSDAYAQIFVGTLQYQGICPEGWHVPYISEWESLINNNDANTLVAKGITEQSFRFADNTTGFTALPAKGMPSETPKEGSSVSQPWWWTTMQSEVVADFKIKSAKAVSIIYYASEPLISFDISTIDKKVYNSIRCVKNHNLLP